MLARKHLVSLIHKPLRHTVSNIRHRALCTEKEKNELEEQQEKKEQYNKEQSEQKHREQKYERAHNKENYKKHEWDDERKSKKWGKWVIGGSIVVGIYVLNYAYTRYQEDKAPRLAFEHGHIPLLDIPSTVSFISKDAEISDLSKIIEASAARGQYLVIYGEHGCRKTTLITQTCNSDMICKRGCVYISIPEPIDIEKKGVKQVNSAKALVAPFSYKHHRLWLYIADAFSRIVAKDDTSPVSLEETLSLIERGAKEFTSRTHQRPILIIDDINHLATAAPLDLEALQDRAKFWADKRILTVIFVSSNKAAPPQLKGRSAYLRAAEYFAHGIPEPVAVDYMSKQLEKEIAEQVVRKLTGDRLHLIIAIATSDLRSYSGILNQCVEGV